jgi:hypothetical protein
MSIRRVCLEGPWAWEGVYMAQTARVECSIGAAWLLETHLHCIANTLWDWVASSFQRMAGAT